MAIMSRFFLSLLGAVAALSLLGLQSHAQSLSTTAPTGTSTGANPGSGLGSSGRHHGAAGESLERRAHEIVKKYDRDGDGALNASELAAFFEAVHQRAEQRHEQGTGSLGSTGTHPGGNPQEHAQRAIAKFDKNGDGKLEPREVAAMLREHLLHHEGAAGSRRVAPATTPPGAPPQS
jgi:hypothetical protein